MANVDPGGRRLVARLREVRAQERAADVLREAVLDALGAGALRRDDPATWTRLTELLEAPVGTAASAAVHLLALETQATLAAGAPDLRDRLARLHPEMGFQ